MSKIPQEAIELLPCPFCGYAITAQEGVCPVDDYVCEETGEWNFKGICCPTCAVFLPASDNASTVYDGVAAWNSRPAFTADATRAQGAEVEPVAWLINNPTNWIASEDLSFTDLTKADIKAGFTSEPLYKRPPAPQPTDRERVLEEALRPFAKLAKVYDPDEGDDEDKCWVHEYTPTLGDLRRARAALAGGEA